MGLLPSTLQALALTPPVAGKPQTSGLDELDFAFSLMGLMLDLLHFSTSHMSSLGGPVLPLSLAS